MNSIKKIQNIPDIFFNKLEEKLKEQFEEFHQLMNQILHKHAVFDFRFENLGNYESI